MLMANLLTAPGGAGSKHTSVTMCPICAGWHIRARATYLLCPVVLVRQEVTPERTG